MFRKKLKTAVVLIRAPLAVKNIKKPKHLHIVKEKKFEALNLKRKKPQHTLPPLYYLILLWSGGFLNKYPI